MSPLIEHSCTYPKLTREIVAQAPEWDETRAETPLVREVAARYGLSIREYMLWQAVSETKRRDRKMWAKTTPRLLREWYKAVRDGTAVFTDAGRTTSQET